VKNLIKEPGSISLTSWVLVAEALAALKKKWLGKGLGDEDYTGRVQELLILILILLQHNPIRPVDLEVVNGEARLKTYEVDIADVRGRHPSLDAADALQFRAIKEGILGCYAGKSKPQLVSADGDLLTAATKDNIPTISVCKD